MEVPRILETNPGIHGTTRAELLKQVRQVPIWDIIVIGGGATGLGTAVDAASRGYSTLLVEGHDFAKGTSSRSTKLVHGGVRYLAQGNISLVYEALKERGRLTRNAPHLVSALPFLVPAYTRWSQPYYGAGLILYSAMAGHLGLGLSRPVNRREAIRRVPSLEPNGLRGGIVYFDGQFDDARLAITLMRTVQDHGGQAINYLPVTSLLHERNRIAGVVAEDTETGEVLTLRGHAVINATGVYADRVRRLDDPTVPPILALSQGIHLVVDRSFLPGDHAIMIPKTDDGRVLFAVPWHDRVLIGTTDTPVLEATIEPRPTRTEVQFLLSHMARYLTNDPTPADVLSVYAGLRPLVKPGSDRRTAAISREHTLIVSPTGLITVTGGKWTTYRRMADDAVSRAIDVGHLTPARGTTKTLRLHGHTEQSAPEPLRVYGSDRAAVTALAASHPGWDQPLHPRLPYLTAEVVWATRHEQARTVEDVLARRTRALLLDARASCQAAPRVAQLMALEFGHDTAWQRDQVRQYNDLACGYLLTEDG